MIAAMEKASFRGLETGWLRAGKKGAPILLFLHGFPDGPEAWQYQVRHFEERFDIVVPFARGLSLSQKGDRLARYGHDAVALDHLECLNQVDPSGKRDVVVIGHDLGGALAAHLAGYLGRRLKGLVLVNGLPLKEMLLRLRFPRQQLRSWYMVPLMVPWIPEWVASHFGHRLLDLAYGMGGLSRERRPRAESAEARLVNPLNQYRAFLADAPTVATRRRKRLEAPVLVLWGSRDSFLVPPTGDELEDFAMNVTVRILAGNHWPHREDPDRVNRILDEFLRETGVNP